MSRFFKYNLIAFCFYFIFSINVLAGVCDGRPVANSVDGTCESDKTYRFKSYQHSSSRGYSVFKTVDAYSYSGEQEYALCIDPGKNSPYDEYGKPYDYNYVRSIQTSGNDLYFYRIYQKYVNAVGYDYGGKENYLQQVDIMSRYLIHHAIPGWSLDGSTFDKNKLLNNSAAKKFYDEAMVMDLWNNPLDFDTSVEFDTSEQLYIFKITVNFTDSANQYFYDTSLGLINGDYNIGYGDAFFEYEFQINDGAYDFGNAVSYNGAISGTINKWMDNPNKSLSFEMKMTKTIYDAIFEAQGKVYLNLKYSTYNAMSDENVIFVKRHKASTTNQRMLVFTKYVKNGVISTDDETSDGFSEPLCKQEGDNFYYDNVLISIDDYIARCNCTAVNRATITNASKKEKYNSICGAVDIIESETFTSTMESCDSGDNGNNTITHNYTSKIASNNEYCSLECTETINVNNFTDKYTVLAGTFFELDNYPSLTATKDCKVNVFYYNWELNYENLVNAEINAVNKRLRDYAINNPDNSSSITCNCGEYSCDSGTKHSYKYKVYYYDVSSKRISYYEKKESYKTGDCGDTKPSTNTDSYNESIVSTKISSLNDHFKKLKDCNKYLYGLGDNYYKFEADLSFYYNQTYSKLGGRWNNNKPDNEDDDSSYTIKLKDDDGYSSGYKENSGTNYDSSNYITDTYEYAYISSTSTSEASINNSYIGNGSYQNKDYEITRIKNFASNYEPSVPKYVDAFTGIVSSRVSNLENPISLIGSVSNNVYDTNVTAIAKQENDNYYQFSTLGDNNEIGEHYNSTNVEKLKRYCKYEITNDIITRCEGATCESDSKLNIIYRVVDENNIDPNGRLNTNNGFKNWKNKKGEVVKYEIENGDTYNPDNLEYSFTLDSATIKKIREYNANCDGTGNCEPISYSSTNQSYSTLDCNDDGNECTTKFIDELYKSDGYFGKNIATNIDGRNKWKYLIYNDTDGKWSIEEKTSLGDGMFESLITQYKSSGVDVIP